MNTHFRPPAPETLTPCLENAEESSLYRQPMDDRQWQENLAAMKARMGFLDQRLIREVSRAIHLAYSWLDEVMERYCEITCPACEDLCCHAAGVFFNHTDLLVILALNLDQPPAQTRSHASAPCHYLTQAGCSLPRVIRPYVCVWYLCEAQMALFQQEQPSFQRQIIATLASVRTHRLKLASHYETIFPPRPQPGSGC